MSKTKRKGRYVPLAVQLRRMIAQSDLTTNALAVAAGVPQPVLHRFIAGDRENIRLDTADKLCEFFGVRLVATSQPKEVNPAGGTPAGSRAAGRRRRK